MTIRAPDDALGHFRLQTRERRLVANKAHDACSFRADVVEVEHRQFPLTAVRAAGRLEDVVCTSSVSLLAR
jgi:hypothetical protein